MTLIKVNLGCGKDIREGWINIDYQKAKGIDIVLNLESYQLPFPDESVDYVLASHILEHLVHWEYLVEEIHRVLKRNGTLFIAVPYGLDATAYHIRSFCEWSLDALCIPDVNANSLEARPLFEMRKRIIYRKIPFSYHITKYLHIKMPIRMRYIGKKSEIHWELVKR